MRFVPCGALEGGLAYNWLDYQTSQGSCKEHERHPGFRQTQRDKIRGSFGATQWHHQLNPFRPYHCGHGHSPYDISTDQKTCTPRSPIVNIGRRAHRGPMILEMPAHCASEVPCSARGRAEKPVICTQTSAGSRPLCFLVKHAQAFAYFQHSASSGKQQ